MFLTKKGVSNIRKDSNFIKIFLTFYIKMSANDIKSPIIRF